LAEIVARGADVFAAIRARSSTREQGELFPSTFETAVQKLTKSTIAEDVAKSAICDAAWKAVNEKRILERGELGEILFDAFAARLSEVEGFRQTIEGVAEEIENGTFNDPLKARLQLLKLQHC
jgi:hypothetical protein